MRVTEERQFIDGRFRLVIEFDSREAVEAMTEEERAFAEMCQKSRLISDKLQALEMVALAIERRREETPRGLLEDFVGLADISESGKLTEVDLRRWMEDIYVGGPGRGVPRTATGAMLEAAARRT